MHKQQRNNMILTPTTQGYSPTTVSAFMAFNKLTTRAIQFINKKDLADESQAQQAN